MLTLSVLLVTFSFLFAVPVGAVEAGYVIDEQITLTFNNAGKGWSSSNQSSGQLTQVDDSAQSGNKYMQFTSTSNAGYNMELANGDVSNTAYILEPSTTYVVKYDLKVISTSTGANVHVSTGTKAAYDPACSKASFGYVKLITMTASGILLPRNLPLPPQCLQVLMQALPKTIIVTSCT